MKIIFSGGSVWHPPNFIFQVELIWYENEFINLLSNLFKEGWMWKNADIYILTLLVFLWQGSVKISEECMKVVNTDGKILMSSEHLEEFEVTLDDIKSHRKIRASPSLSKRYIFRRTTGGKFKFKYIPHP